MEKGFYIRCLATRQGGTTAYRDPTLDKEEAAGTAIFANVRIVKLPVSTSVRLFKSARAVTFDKGREEEVKVYMEAETRRSHLSVPTPCKRVQMMDND